MKLKPEPETNIIIEQKKHFSSSCLWQMQRDYFEQEGILAWASQVPFFVTSNPVVAKNYALLTIHFIRDWIKKYPESRNHPFYILELGTGSGQLSFFVLKELKELRKALSMEDIAIRYIMSDFTLSNLKYWDSHPALIPFIEDGMLDFAIYNMENDDPITLQKQGITLTPEHFANPLTVFANYIFDTISHDIFAISNNKLHEVLISQTTSSNNMLGNKPIDWEQVTIDYTPHEISANYYPDEHLNAVLREYQTSFKDTNILFPIGGLLAIKKLKKLTNDKVFLISSDKGYSSLDTLDYLGYPTLAFHGSFSMMVNFHAIARYFKHSGGDYHLQTTRKGIKTCVFSSGFELNDMPETRLTIQQVIENFSPADYFILHRRMSDSFQECQLDTLASHMAFSNWDPYIFHKLNSRICSTVEEAESATITYMVDNMKRIAANYYYMPKSDNTLFEIAVFLHLVKRYDQALVYYQQAEPYCEDSKFGLFYNMALCQHHLGLQEDALVSFKKAHEIDSDSKEVNEWITYLEPSTDKPEQSATQSE